MEERKRGRRGRGRKVEGVMEEGKEREERKRGRRVEGVMEEGKEREVEREKGGRCKRGVREERSSEQRRGRYEPLFCKDKESVQ